MRLALIALPLALPLGLAVAAPALADDSGAAPQWTRLDLVATGEAERTPDLATITAGVVTQAGRAADAMSANAQKMAAAIAALKRAGIADRDVSTASLSLQPQYRYGDNQPPVLTGYQASDQLTIRFRDLKRAGPILDALVAQGINQIGGPDLSVEHPEAALDEARAQAIAQARARAQLYARAAGMSVARIVTIAEQGGGGPVQPPRPMMMMARAEKADTAILAGSQSLQVTVNVTFELR